MGLTIRREETQRSHGDQLDVDARTPGKYPKVICVRGQDVVTVSGEGHEGGIDDIGRSSMGEEHPSLTPQSMVEPLDLDALEQSCDGRLPAFSPTPHLAHDTPMRQRGPPSNQLTLQ
jgi:hypothetical protein